MVKTTDVMHIKFKSQEVGSSDVTTIGLFDELSDQSKLSVGLISRASEGFSNEEEDDAKGGDHGVDNDIDDADDFAELASQGQGGSSRVEVVDLMDWLISDDTQHERMSIRVDSDREMKVSDHDMLVYHMRMLLDMCDGAVRRQLLNRMDRVNAAFQARTENGMGCNDEAQQELNNPTNNHNDYLVLPVVHPKVVDTATVLSNILFPPTEMYSAISRKDKQAAAKACASRMTKDAKQFGHFTQLYNAVLNLVRYNVAAVLVKWTEIQGQQIIPDEATGKVAFNTGAIHKGNEVRSIDPHNLYWDINVPNFTQLSTKGQYVAYAEAVSLFNFVKDVREGRLFGSTEVDQPPKHGMVMLSSYPGYYHRDPPHMADRWELGPQDCSGEARGEVPTGSRLDAASSTDWHSEALGGMAFGAPGAKKGQLNVRGRVELVRMYCRMRGTDFGFVGDKMDQYAVWELVLLNGRRVVLARPLAVPHGRLPIQISAIFQDDESLSREKSLAELMVPFQQHVQDIINKLQQTLKKGLAGGLTIYDKDKVELDRDKNPISGYVPVKNLPDDGDIRKRVMQLNNLPDSTNALSHVQELNRLLENVMPTQQAQQVADLQRATEFQAAATVAASAKRHLTVAKIIDDTLMMPLRMMQFMNLLQSDEVVELIDDNGDVQQFTPAALAQAGLEFDISQGLLGMDRLILSARYFQLLNLIVQGNMAMQVDFLGMLNYYTSLIGDPTDFNMFKMKTPFDALTPDQKAQAFQLLQAAGQQPTGNNGQGTVPTPQQ